MDSFNAFVFVSGKFGMYKYLYGLLHKLTRNFCIMLIFYGRRIAKLWAMQTTMIAEVMVLIHSSECAKRAYMCAWMHVHMCVYVCVYVRACICVSKALCMRLCERMATTCLVGTLVCINICMD